MMTIGVVLMMAAAEGAAAPVPAPAPEDTMLEAKVYDSPAGGQLKYRIAMPKGLGPGAKCPLVLFLHGAGERGGDNRAQLKHGIRSLMAWLDLKRVPAIVVVPQCPAGKKWAEVDWSKDSHTMPEQPSESMRMVFELCDKMKVDMPVDPARVYITGISMGGYGTWDAIQRRPDYFAAAMPVCGGGDTNGAPVMKDIPLWVFHGDQDAAVKVSRSRDMVEAIKQAGGNPKYTEYPGVGHDCWTRTYENAAVWDWLFGQKKGAKPAP